MPATSDDRIEEVVWRGARAESEGVLLGRVPARQEVQLWTWTLAEGERYDAQPDPDDWHEIIVVTEGRLRIDRADSHTSIGPGEYGIYSSGQPYSYVNIHPGITRFIRNVAS